MKEFNEEFALKKDYIENHISVSGESRRRFDGQISCSFLIIVL